MKLLTQSRKIVVIWLSVVCFTIFVMVVVGGATRLTHSGLSMVDWRPIMGVIPPLSQEEWRETFEMYKQFPEYQQVNRHLDLEGFKRIFYWEYGHRLLGRLIGVIFFVPFVWLWIAGRIEKPMIPKLLVALALGGLQGLMGWYMVKSGLVDMPRVSHYRLAAHLLLALLILGYLFWLILDLLAVRKEEAASPGFVLSTRLLLAVITLQILYGAFTAGIRAGFGFNTFPKMHDQWIADAVFMMDPWWINLFESSATIQFVHRWLGILLLAVTAGVWLWAWRQWQGTIRWSASTLGALMVVQVLLGILTLVYVVPITLATLHQAMACLLLLSAIHLIYVSR